MSLIRWEPFRDLMNIREAMDRMFEESFFRPWRSEFFGESGLIVPMDVYEKEGNLVISAALPGVKPEDVDISVTGNVLTIKGEFKKEEEMERENVHFQERRYGSFRRSISLPSNYDTDNVDATFEDGILKIMLPQKEEAKPKQIEVKARSSEQQPQMEAMSSSQSSGGSRQSKSK